jgi:hypothetical protein
MIKLNLSNPVANGLATTAGLAAWKASHFSTDPATLIAVATAALSGVASPNADSSKANVSADSHIVTPYANNIESE